MLDINMRLLPARTYCQCDVQLYLLIPYDALCANVSCSCASVMKSLLYAFSCIAKLESIQMQTKVQKKEPQGILSIIISSA